jgi:hypothetical protein
MLPTAPGSKNKPNNQQTELLLAACFLLEVASSSEMSVIFCQTALRHITEDTIAVPHSQTGVQDITFFLQIFNFSWSVARKSDQFRY